MLSFDTSAIGCVFIGLNASLLVECIFFVFVAGRIKHDSSSIEECMQIPTSLKSDSRINLTARNKFRKESDDGLSEDLCEPTRRTGVDKPSNAKDNADEV